MYLIQELIIIVVMFSKGEASASSVLISTPSSSMPPAHICSKVFIQFTLKVCDCRDVTFDPSIVLDSLYARRILWVEIERKEMCFDERIFVVR